MEKVNSYSYSYLALDSLLSEMYMFVNRPGDLLASLQEGYVHYCNNSC